MVFIAYKLRGGPLKDSCSMILERKAEATANHLQQKWGHSNPRCSDLGQRSEKIHDWSGGKSKQKEAFGKWSLQLKWAREKPNPICFILVLIAILYGTLLCENHFNNISWVKFLSIVRQWPHLFLTTASRAGTIVTTLQMSKGGRKGFSDLATCPQLAGIGSGQSLCP